MTNEPRTSLEKPGASDESESTHRKTIEVLGFAGSIRKGSFNRALLRAARELSPEGMRITSFELDEIPFYNYDVEKEGDPEAVQAFKNAIRDADALLIATPEYQHSVPGLLKNALDWASRPPRESALRGKPAAIMGATPGRLGTARAQSDLRKVLVYNDIHVLNRPAVLVRHATNKFDDDLRLVDEDTRDHVRKLLAHLDAWTRFVSGWSPPE